MRRQRENPGSRGLMQAMSQDKQLQHLIYYFQGRNGTKSAETVLGRGEVNRRVTKQCCTRGAQGISEYYKLSTRRPQTDSHSPTRWEELGSQGLKLQVLTQNPGPGSLLGLPSRFVLHTLEPQEKTLWIQPSTVHHLNLPQQHRCFMISIFLIKQHDQKHLEEEKFI